MLDKSPVSLHNLKFYIGKVGNPHAVTFVDDIHSVNVKDLGFLIENDTYFPNKTNVEFVEIVADDYIKLRIWERGVGETAACGTGMVTSASIASKFKNVTFPMKVEVPGGLAKVYIDSDGYSHLVGPAEYI